MPRVRCALISVADKSGIADFAAAIVAMGVNIISTGNTARHLSAHGIAVVEVSEHTGFPEIMGGRVKTLHPRIHGALLGDRQRDAAEMERHQISPIDLLVVNLYPFARTVATPGCDHATALENIDIGGVAMLRAAAKNYSQVAAVIDSGDYAAVLESMQANAGRVNEGLRLQLARKAFTYTAAYDAVIAAWLSAGGAPREQEPLLAPLIQRSYRKHKVLRYGENPHQAAALYVSNSDAVAVAPDAATDAATGINGARQLQGKLLSYNNIVDTDVALACVRCFTAPACVIVKHANPCGAALAGAILTAYQRAYATDPTSAFGGIIAFNRPLDAATTAAIIDRQFVEVIIAPGVVDEAAALLRSKDSIRVLVDDKPGVALPELEFKQVSGGMLVQHSDSFGLQRQHLKQVTNTAPHEAQWQELLFAFTVAAFVKSNAIVYTRDQRTLGIGGGQTSRVYSARIAGLKAADEGLSLDRAVMASDAFFPFRDSIDVAAKTGISAVIQPGGSLRDAEVIAAANEHGLAMVFSGRRHFRH